MLLPMLYSALHLSLEPYLLKVIIDRVTHFTGPPENLFKELAPLFTVFVGAGLVVTAAWRIKDYSALRILPPMRTEIIGTLFSYINLHSYRYYQENFAGDLANKIKEVSTGIEDLIENFREIFRQSALVFVAAGMTLFVHYQVSVILLVWALVFIGLSFFMSKDIMIDSEKLADSRSVVFGKIVDSISNHNNVRLFGRHHFERTFLQSFLKAIQTQDVRLRFKMMFYWAVQGTLASAMLGIVLYALIHLKSLGKVTVGDFAFVIWVSVALIEQVWVLSETLSKLPQHLGVCSQGLALIAPDHEITDEPTAQNLRITRGEIEFQSVTFCHQAQDPLFHQLNLKIRAGEKVGLVGFSGSGKSTFAHLLVRLFDLEKGKILIDGQEIQKITQQSLRESVSFIPQDPSLFHRSLMENIRYGAPLASDEEVLSASKQAHAHDFITRTPEGYQTMVGERGIKLSGGQRQRISIARAILKNAPILILDEATSALDSVTEALIQDSLRGLMKGKTALVIAHRLSTLLEMDRILVFDHGKIIEDGTHQELIEKRGHYCQLWNSQVGGFLPERQESDNISLKFI